VDNLDHSYWPRHLPHTPTPPQVRLEEHLDVSARRYPDKAAFIFYGSRLTYRQLHDQVEKLAGDSQAQGLRDAAACDGGAAVEGGGDLCHVWLTGANRSAAKADAPCGSADRPLSRQDLIAKYQRLARRASGDSEVLRVQAEVLELETLPNISSLTAMRQVAPARSQQSSIAAR
jgi:hypothetical protein